MKMKEESEKVGLKLNIQKIKIMASGWGNNENSERLYFIFLAGVGGGVEGLQNHYRRWLQPWN